MPILKIARMGHPILKQISKEVPDPTAPDVARLVSSMIETMNDAEGTGLAAPQVHMPWRIVVYKVMADRIGGEVSPQIKNEGVPTTVLINPVVEPIGDETDVSFEACLSVPGMAGPVERFRRINLTYQNLSGEKLELLAEGFHARVIQHECDHLDGILYPVRIKDLSQFGFVDELGKQEESTHPQSTTSEDLDEDKV